VVLAVGVAATWLLQPYGKTIAWLPAVVVGHFFLFCNVFRVRSRFELPWAAVFLANFAFHAVRAGDGFSWQTVLLVQTPFTVAAIAGQIASRDYHGIFCRTARDPD
jgi:hypothetical protein